MGFYHGTGASQGQAPDPECEKPLPLATHSVLMRMSLFFESSTHLQISSWVTGMAMWLDTHRSER